MTTITGARAGVMEVLAEGVGAFHPVDPDGYREWVRDHKSRALTPKVMTAKEAVERFVADGDYVSYDCNYLMRGPNAVIHEVIRQRRQRLWLAGKFTYVDVALLVAAGCADRVDCGFFLATPVIQAAVRERKLEVFEYSNVVMTVRLQAGAMGLPFLPVRSFGGTDGFDNSGAKLVKDPYTGIPITLVPALNPDVGIVHVHQADQYGNARVFGTGVAHVETAMASRKVIISAEEIIDTEEIRRDPGRTVIPYYAVDAVVPARWGTFPGNCPGYYGSDPGTVMEAFRAISSTGAAQDYLEKWVYGVSTFEEALDRYVGVEKLEAMRAREVIREGYHA